MEDVMRRWRLELDTDPCAARIVRHIFDDWLPTADCREDDWLDARLAVSELVTIAVGETVEPIIITATHDSGRVLVAVEHHPLFTDDASPRYERMGLLFETSCVQVTSIRDGTVHRAQMAVEY
jgi:anti-sigma regulatory factor (Ser/Thr protein kinase)